MFREYNPPTATFSFSLPTLIQSTYTAADCFTGMSWVKSELLELNNPGWEAKLSSLSASSISSTYNYMEIYQFYAVCFFQCADGYVLTQANGNYECFPCEPDAGEFVSVLTATICATEPCADYILNCSTCSRPRLHHSY